ncbi:MAG: formylglycine-generating enzyme family protein [Hyphomicrobiales bacterium]
MQTQPPTTQHNRAGADQGTSVNVPGGKATVGTNNPIIHVDGEGPQRHLNVRPFRMDVGAVTNGQFQCFVDDTGYATDAERLGNSFVFKGSLPNSMQADEKSDTAPWWQLIDGANWQDLTGQGSVLAHTLTDHPVVHVTWNDARAYAQWAGGRLPSEAEWEHAARGGRGDVRFPWGDEEPNDQDFFPCNIWQGAFPDINLASDGYISTAPAISFEPNGYGLYNMVGNVWEWTAEPFKVRSLKRTAIKAHAGNAGYKLMKGGSFLCHQSYCYRYRIASRSGTSPDSSTSHQGFRLVYDAYP